MMAPMSYDTPESAALASWTTAPAAEARVVSVDLRGDRAEVVLDTIPSYLDYVYCLRTSDGWQVTVSGNGTCVGWDDPSVIDWS
jgi:hypothetical protein